MIEINNISKKFIIKNIVVEALLDIYLIIEEKDCFAIVGESGSGKSVTSLSAMRLIPSPPGVISGGKIIFHQSHLDFFKRHILIMFENIVM